ncbi:MAG: hypothetical protein M3P08_11690 [Thermoproteota archaeon]|nr:hypothetical protein [Thermoproteota archaeon]
MYENLVYPIIIGFATTLLALEAAWHFTACKLPDKIIKPCIYKQVKLVLLNAKQTKEDYVK